MLPYSIPDPFDIPYFDHGSNIGQTIRNSSSRRKMSPLKFALRKFRNICLYRMAYFCPFNSLRVKMHRRRGVHIGKNVYIGQQCCLDNAYPEFIFIEDNVSIVNETTILTHVNPYEHFRGIIESRVVPVVVEEGAWIGAKCILTAGAHIGKYSIVSAGSVVGRKMPAYSMIAGNPAKKIYDFKDSMLNDK